MKKNNIVQEEETGTTWNMGSFFYKTLDELKWGHMLSFIDKEYETSIDFLSSEIDWVGQDIRREELNKLRVKVDNIRNELLKPMNTVTRRNIVKQILICRRDLWDAEMRANITRPKDTTDLSNTPMAIINNR